MRLLKRVRMGRDRWLELHLSEQLPAVVWYPLSLCECGVMRAHFVQLTTTATRASLIPRTTMYRFSCSHHSCVPVLTAYAVRRLDVSGDQAVQRPRPVLQRRCQLGTIFFSCTQCTCQNTRTESHARPVPGFYRLSVHGQPHDHSLRL